MPMRKTNSSQVTGPAFTYVGSKWNMASDLCRFVNRIDANAYVEPFAGSLAVLLSKLPHTIECVNDLDDYIVNFYTVLRDEPDEFIHRCMLTPYAREEYERARSEIVFVTEPIERARLWWVLQTQTINGKGSSFRCSGNTGITDFVSRLRAIAERLRLVAIENTDALELIDRMDAADTLFYLDPPYMMDSRSSKGAVYEVENGSESFHTKLLEVIRNIKGAVILSGYPHPLYNDALDGWYRREWTFYASSGAINGGEQRSTRQEVVWSNRDVLVDAPSLFEFDLA